MDDLQLVESPETQGRCAEKLVTHRLTVLELTFEKCVTEEQVSRATHYD
jgi:hypothetical protein